MENALSLGLIRKADPPAPYTSAVIVALKTENDLCFCNDHRPLNKITVKDHFPLPKIDDLLSKLHGKRLFSSLDLASGYWKIPMEKGSIYKTAFIMRNCVYKWLVPFGMTNGVFTFQRAMNAIF